jgi:hypothetical protein
MPALCGYPLSSIVPIRALVVNGTFKHLNAGIGRWPMRFLQMYQTTPSLSRSHDFWAGDRGWLLSHLVWWRVAAVA